jgi:hypothetical protein
VKVFDPFIMNRGMREEGRVTECATQRGFFLC